MKTIVISIRPEWAREILNRHKTIEVRRGLALYNALKKAEDNGEEAEFHMYVTKDKKNLLVEASSDRLGEWFATIAPNHKETIPGFVEIGEPLNGMVVARFKAKAETIKYHNHRNLDDWDGYCIDRGEKIGIGEIELCESSCLNHRQLDDYLQEKDGTAIRIRDIKVFDKPKTIADYGLKRAPQSWCYAKEAKNESA